MKAALVISDGVKQIMLSPDTDEEKMILTSVSKEDDLSVEFKTGSFYENYDSNQVLGYNVNKCRGGFMRAFQEDGCLMIVLTRKEK